MLCAWTGELEGEPDGTQYSSILLREDSIYTAYSIQFV